MAKKKKGEFTLSRRGKEKLRLSLRHFDFAALACLTLVVICTVLGGIGPYDLGKGNLNGFALWFLLIPAYLPLEILGIAAALFHCQWNFAGHEALLLGCCDTILMLILWLAVRFWGKRRGILFVRAARIFVMIFVCWGIFQLLCIASLWIWRHGGFQPLHHHLEHTEEPVAVKVVP